MWGKESSRLKPSKTYTLIGHETEIQGNLLYEGGLHVDGTVKGNVVANEDSKSMLVVSERGRIEGEVRVPRLVLNGQVVGDVYASERVELAKHARVTGNVYYNMLQMAIGAEINGNMVHRAHAQGESPLLEHKRQKKEKTAAIESAGAEVKVAEEAENTLGAAESRFANDLKHALSGAGTVLEKSSQDRKKK